MLCMRWHELNRPARPSQQRRVFNFSAMTMCFLRCESLVKRCVAVVLLAAGSAVCAQGVLVAPKPAVVPGNALAEAAANVGVKRCLPALTRISSLAVDGARANDLLMDWDRKRVDSSPLFALIGLEYPNGGAAMSIAAVPEADGACSIIAERVSMAPFTCQSVAQQELVGYRQTRLLSNFSVYTDSKDPTASVSLIDSPPGCIVIRRYVEFNWKETLPPRK